MEEVDADHLTLPPQAGFFGVAPGTNSVSNPNALATVSRNALFTNVALTNDGDVWWEGLSPKPPQPLRSWRGEDYVAGVTKGPAAHANSRFTVSAAQVSICLGFALLFYLIIMTGCSSC